LKLRKVTEDDRAKIVAFIANDPFHKDAGTSDFFFEPFADSMVISDDEGHEIFVRIARALRVNAVFDARESEANKKLMAELAAFLKQSGEESGFREVVYTSANPRLRAFGETLGFVPQPDLVMTLEPVERVGSQGIREPS
jgi:hypothetical protein